MLLRSRRVLALLLSMLVGLVLAGLGPTGSALAVAKPAISAVGSGAGPLARTKVLVTGSNLSGATAVTFGSKAGSIVRVISSTQVEVKTPSGAKPGRVTVRIKTPGGWSSASAKSARYTFVAKPSLSKLAPTSGRYTGGQRVKLTGKNLKATTAVQFGAAKAKIVSRKKTSVVVTTPVGVLGAAKVTVTSPGGTSGSRTFTYRKPAREDKTTVAVAEDAYVPASVDWVTGGYDADTQTQNPWVIGLPKTATAPEVGKPFVIKPGTTAYPTGLAGTVDAVAVQGDDSMRVTVQPTDLAGALDRYSVDYVGSLSEAPGKGKRDSSTSIEFPLDHSALFCHDDNGQSVAFGAEMHMYITDIDVSHHVDLGGFIHRPSMDTTLTLEVKTVGTFHGEAASTCKIAAAWANAHRKVLWLGDGATLSFGPAFSFSVSAKGTFKILDRTRTTWAVDAELGKTPQFSRTSRSVEHKVTAALTFSATLSAGVDIRLGIFDRAGATVKIMLGLSAEVETENLDNVCITAKLILDLSVALFLDAWVETWESPSLHATFDLHQFVHECMVPETDQPDDDEPSITSARMTDSSIGSAYQDRLQTADNRNGTWSIVRNALPAGLSLDRADGEISGTPTGPVGDYAVIIDFQDAAGRVATTVIRIRVLPQTGIGGGDIQVTLQWVGAADLDLHVADPTGEEIYYAQPTSSSGGELDHDANAGCNGPTDDDNAVENVFWPPHSAPAGDYQAWVVVYNPCDAPLDWHLTVRRNGAVIIDQTGNGASAAYPFRVGAQGRGKALPTRTAPVRHYPAK